MRHLWEYEHPYYCHDNNYFSNKCSRTFNSWKEFLAEEGESDLNMNLVFRFDCKPVTDDNGDYLPVDTNGFILSLFIIGQRKGLFRTVAVKAKCEDEQSIIAYLKPRLAKLKSLWKPLR